MLIVSTNSEVWLLKLSRKRINFIVSELPASEMSPHNKNYTMLVYIYLQSVYLPTQNYLEHVFYPCKIIKLEAFLSTMCQHFYILTLISIHFYVLKLPIQLTFFTLQQFNPVPSYPSIMRQVFPY